MFTTALVGVVVYYRVSRCRVGWFHTTYKDDGRKNTRHRGAGAVCESLELSVGCFHLPRRLLLLDFILGFHTTYKDDDAWQQLPYAITLCYQLVVSYRVSRCRVGRVLLSTVSCCEG